MNNIINNAYDNEMWARRNDERHEYFATAMKRLCGIRLQSWRSIILRTKEFYWNKKKKKKTFVNKSVTLLFAKLVNTELFISFFFHLNCLIINDFFLVVHTQDRIHD